MTSQTITYQGIEGAFSHIAASYLFPDSIRHGLKTFEEVFSSCKKDKATSIIVPLDNTLIGSIYEVYDLLLQYDFKISQEISLKIDLNLLGTGKLNQIKKVYSHTKALEQCKNFFTKNPDIQKIVYHDTAAAAKYVADSKNPELGAIASLHAAHLYKLNILKSKIQSDQTNFTRFVVVSKKAKQPRGNKTSIIFAAAHKPGSLLDCLKPFAGAHLNLTKIQSRPLIGQPWSYVFYLDFEHPVDNKLVEEVLKEVSPHTQMLKKLGTYQSGQTIAEISVNSTPHIKVL
jgi:prephenate dehydratase